MRIKTGKIMTNSELIVLGLLAEEDCYGYQIEKKIKERNIRHWAEIGFSSIYHVLSKLEGKGLVTSRQEKSAQGPVRRVFAITSIGKRHLTGQALKRLAQRLPLPSTFYVGVALLQHIDREKAHQALAEHALAVRARLKQLNEASQSSQQMPMEAQAMFDLGYLLAKAEESWLEDFTTRLRSMSGEP